MEWTQEQRQRVAKAMIARRGELNIKQAEAVERSAGGVSLPVWGIMENGRQGSYKPRTLAGVCRALGWTTDSIERLLDGKPPGLVLTAVSQPTVAADVELAELRARVQDLEDLWEVVLQRAVAAGRADQADAEADAARRSRQARRAKPGT